MSIFSKLPTDVINIIINYTDVIVYRFGKYLNRINKNDIKYTKISHIPRPIKLTNEKYSVALLNKKNTTYNTTYKLYILTYYTINNDNVKKYYLDVDFIKRRNNKYGKKYEYTTSETYIYNYNYKWSKIVHYLM